MDLYTCDEGIVVRARTEKSARRKMEKIWRAAVTNVRMEIEIDDETLVMAMAPKVYRPLND